VDEIGSSRVRSYSRSSARGKYTEGNGKLIGLPDHSSIAATRRRLTPNSPGATS